MQITVRSAHPRRARLAQEELQRAGVEATACVGLMPTALHEDIALLDVSDGNGAWANATAASLRSKGLMPRAIAALAPLSCPPVADEVFDAWIQLDAAAGMVQRDLRDIQRAAVAREELEARSQTAGALGAPSPAPRSMPAPRCLFVGDPHPFYLCLTHAMAALDGGVEAAFSSFAGFDQLHDAPFDAAVVNASTDPALALMLCGAMRRNKRLTQMPTVVLGAGGEFAREAAARGAALVLDGAVAPETAMAWTLEKMRRSRRARQTDMGLAAHTVQVDEQRSLMEAHMSTLGERAHQLGYPLSVAALQVSVAPGARKGREQDWRRGVVESCDIARRLVRSSDSVALMPDDVIVIAFPAATRAQALRAVERVAAVAECTAFASGEKDAGPIVLARHVVELAPGESGARLLRRSLEVHGRMGVTA